MNQKIVNSIVPLFFALVSCMAFSACDNNDDVTSDNQSSAIIGTWQLNRFKVYTKENGKYELQNVVNYNEMEAQQIKFEEDNTVYISHTIDGVCFDSPSTWTLSKGKLIIVESPTFTYDYSIWNNTLTLVIYFTVEEVSVKAEYSYTRIQ